MFFFSRFGVGVNQWLRLIKLVSDGVTLHHCKMANSRSSIQAFRMSVPHVRIIPASTKLISTQTTGWQEAHLPLILSLKAGLKGARGRMLVKGHARHEVFPCAPGDEYSRVVVKPWSAEGSFPGENSSEISTIAFDVPATKETRIFFEPGISTNVSLLTQSFSSCTVLAFGTGAMRHHICNRRGYQVYPIDDDGCLPAPWSGRLGAPRPSVLPGNDGAVVPAAIGATKARKLEAIEVIDLTGEVEEGDHMEFDAGQMDEFSNEGDGDPYSL